MSFGILRRWRNRRWSNATLLTWHQRIEIANHGYFVAETCQQKAHRFSVGKFLGDGFDECTEVVRFSDSEFAGNWNAIKHPWEKEEPSQWYNPQFHDEREKMKYLDTLLFWLKAEGKADTVGVIYPYGDALPLGYAVRDGKVTLY